MIGTGGTSCNALYICKKYNAKDVVMMVPHGATLKGVKKVRNTYDHLYLGNTIDKRGANVDVTTPLILEAYRFL